MRPAHERSWHQEQHRAFVDRWAQDDADRRRRGDDPNGGGILQLMILMTVVAVGLVAARHYGYSLSDLWHEIELWLGAA
ncbi:hypothetical protein [Spirillospora sp. NPDC047279]|uniref:hypothetical protein n=1 Tax=Spirillospora sp. NPDC047279 TaxID=3155478 RepID=UPI00340EDBEF